MGKPTAFLEIDRETPEKRPKEERVKDSREIYEPFPEEKLRSQASRCMDCAIPFCHQGCPLGNLIPDFNDLVYRGRFEEAAARLGETNNFPEMTGRLCPAPCEASCVLGIHADPVTIKQVELEISERGFAEGWYEPKPAVSRTGRRVAVVGSGPAGLACAQELAREGHDVVVFEKADRPGGLLRYGIPDFKMDRAILDRRLDQMKKEGVVFRCGVEVGRHLTAAELREGFDAVGLATGALLPRGLDVPGADLPGVHLALTYLEQENRVQAGDSIPELLRINAEGKRVVILGGGDTGADCLGTAHRQRALSVLQLEIAPRPPEARGADDPWPTWPNIYRVSPAHEEGGERAFAIRTLRIEGTSGRVSRLVAERVEWSNGAMVSTGEEITYDADLVLVATGYLGPEPSALYAALGVELDARGRISADDNGTTSGAGVFAMGDARRGASLIVWAIAEGRRAARSISSYLAGRRLLKTA
ncbi:MAG: glutamate synthase subunit beta [Myxococcales bacterium]|nr:glutamate synthase subunit beta [Myxococcales bacterium]